MRELLPVILQRGLKKLLEEGCSIEIVCLETARKVGTAWRGRWRIYVITHGDNGEEQRLSLVATRNIEPRVIKTVVGLVSFAREHGISVVGIPLEKGRVVRWRRDGAET